MSVLVTGAAGFIGSHLCERLLRAGEEVVGLDSFDDFYAPALKERNLCVALEDDSFQIVRGDIRDATRLGELPDGIDRVVHLAARAAARPSLSRPALYADVNVTGTANVLEWARRRGVQALVYASSSSVYGDASRTPFVESEPLGEPLSPYGATKRAGELLCRSVSGAGGPAIASLRFFTVYGPRQRPDLAIHKFARILREGGAIPVYGDGTSSRDYTYVDDIVAGTVAALEWAAGSGRRYGVFNLGNDEAVTLSAMVHTLADAMGVSPTIDYRPLHPSDLLHTRADIELARRELGYGPTTDFRCGIERFVDWFAKARS